MEDLMDKKDDKDINYSNLTMEALRDVVYKVLKITEKKGLLENHHFYITFLTSAPGIKIPDFLKKQYPDEVTIVIQHKFWNLKVYKNYFSVTLKFNNKVTELNVTYKSIIAFNDPSSKFSLRWEKPNETSKNKKNIESFKQENQKIVSNKSLNKKQKKSTNVSTENKIVDLDSYRKDLK